MTGADTYRFHKATVDDLDMLVEWHSHPHVSAWWGSGQPYDKGKLNDTRVARWIVTANERPFAFMQDYSVHDWEDHHFSQLPKGSRGIDQFIGDPTMIGLGHGTRFIAARVRVLFEEGAPVVATDPHPDNARAIAVYRKLGFEAFGSPQETEWGLILPMRINR